MDPNETLKYALRIVGDLHDADTDGMTPEQLRETAERGCMLAEYLYYLDTWLLKGGFIPQRWEQTK